MIERRYSATINRGCGDIDVTTNCDGNIEFDGMVFTVEEAADSITALTEAIASIQANAPKPKPKATKKGGAK
jgi:hypothetical protein